MAKIRISIEIKKTRCCNKHQYGTKESSDDLKSNEENIDDVIKYDGQTVYLPLKTLLEQLEI